MASRPGECCNGSGKVMKVKSSEVVVNGSPRSRSKAKSILWLKNLLQSAGCVIFEGEKGSNVIDDCFQVPLPSLQKFSAAIAKESQNSNILSTLAFKNILRNICALRSEYVMRIAKPVLQKLMSHDRNRNTFNQPVDPVELGIPTYFETIKVPMDLGTVMSNLRGGRYPTIKACFNDIELVFFNAMTFNHASHDVHKMARDLLADFHAEVKALEEKCLKESEKRSQHSCSLCCGSTCQLCGEKCLKFEPPSLNCQQCGTRIKKNGVFYVCADGSALWCQKCYMTLPPVITPAAPRPLHAVESTAELEGGESSAGSGCSASAVDLTQDGGHDSGLHFDDACAMDTEGGMGCDPICAVSTCDSESVHEPSAASLHRSCSGGSCINRDSSNGDDTDAPLLKKHLLKRRADEEVAEPWVACDSCGNWYHQICALYSKLGETSATAKSFCCPFCVLLSASQHAGSSDLDLCLAEAVQNAPVTTSPGAPGRRRLSSTGDDHSVVSTEGAAVLTCPAAAAECMDVEVPSPRVDDASSDKLSASQGAEPAAGKVKFNLTVKFEVDTLFKNIFEYSELSSPGTPHHPEDDETQPVLLFETSVAEDLDSQELATGVANVSANSSCAGMGLSSEDEHLMDDESVHELPPPPEKTTAVDANCAVEKEMETVKREDVRPATPLLALSSSPVPAPAALDPAASLHWKWRASSLPHTQLGDFLEALVRDLLRGNNFPDAADSITIRMTTNQELSLDVPVSISKNLVAPTGNIIPERMGYKQKCILLFQEVDGVDVCLFSLYVHEFDAKCPSPNTSTVYIAYLDSVDYFRPITARTMVYQEIVAGYLKWSQARGFKQAHIWSCPPHRGDNFIFNAHPAHQKYPSRERLNHWYKSILQRCSKLGIIAETGNLWQQYFSKYVRRDAVPVARQAALNSFVGSGKAVRKTNAKPKKKALTPSQAAALASAVDLTAAVPEVEEVGAPATSKDVSGADAAVSTAFSDAPVCPPIFDGDYWVQQYVYLIRLHTQKVKGQSSATQRQQLGVRKFRDLLKRLMTREESAPFLQPVDHIALDIPNYALVVKHPMDMSTVKEKLGAGEYPSAWEFVKDVRLIFANAKLFNPPDHAVHVAADFISLKFEKGLALTISELRELNSGSNGLLRMPIPGSSPDEKDSAEAFLKSVMLSFPVKSAQRVDGQVAVAAALLHNSVEPTFHCESTPSAERATSSSPRVDTKASEHVYRTPQCKAVSRSGSVEDERNFGATVAVSTAELSAQKSTTGTRSRAQSISITPVLSDPTAALQLPPPPSAKVEVDAVSEEELVADLAQRQLQRVVSQDFPAAARAKLLSDDRKKRVEDLATVTYASPESAAKRRRLSEDISAAAAVASEIDAVNSFSADALNLSHQAVPFTAPALGSQNIMTIVAELSKRMQRQYDDLFVIKLTPPTPANLFNDAATYHSDAACLASGASVASAVPVKKPRGRVALIVRKTPAMHIPGGLKCMGPRCRALLSALTPDTTDPDPTIRSPVTDSRHIFLELCQFRHYQFDSLRRAKHSSLMLLYHLQNPHDKCCHAVCSHCDASIQSLRWHCDECPTFDLCGSCYTADMARRTGPLSRSHHTSFSIDASLGQDELLLVDRGAAAGRITGESGLTFPHPHTLTPYRVSNY